MEVFVASSLLILALMAIIFVFRKTFLLSDWISKGLIQGNTYSELQLIQNHPSIPLFQEKTFIEFVSGSGAMSEIQDQAGLILERSLARELGYAVQMVQHYSEPGRLVVEVSAKGASSLRQGNTLWTIHKKTGRILPTIRDAKTGRFVEQAKSVGPSAVSKATKLASVIVSAAHVISGADVINKLNQLNAKVDFLIAARRIDQWAELESIYHHLREVSSSGDVSRSDLLDNYRRIGNLRIQSRKEILHRLESIEDPRSWGPFRTLFSMKKNTDKKTANEIEAATELRQFYYTSLNMQLALSIVLDLDQQFTSLTVSEERDQLQKILDLLETRASFLVSKEVASRNQVASVKRQLGSLMTWYDAFEFNSLLDIDDKYTSYEIQDSNPKPSSLLLTQRPESKIN